MNKNKHESGQIKIIFFIDNLLAGGKERRFTELLKGLKEDDQIEFEIVVMSKEIYYKEIFDLKVKIHYLIRNSKYDLTVFRKFYTICKNYKPDIIHCWASISAVIAIPTCKILKIKLLNGMVIDTPVKRNFTNKYWLQAKISFPFSDKIIGNSNAGLKAYGAPTTRSICIHNGMDFNRFQNLKNQADLKREIFGNKEPDFIVGMVARFESRKDYKTLIKAAINLHSLYKNMHFILVGEGTELEEMKETVPLPSQDNIIFLGGRTDVESVVNLFDVGVLLTNAQVHGEGISNSIIEYMALRKPVIATSGGGTNEVIDNNVNGYLIHSGNYSQLESSIQQLVENPDIRERFGNAGFQMARERFDSKIVTKKYSSLYREFI